MWKARISFLAFFFLNTKKKDNVMQDTLIDSNSLIINPVNSRPIVKRSSHMKVKRGTWSLAKVAKKASVGRKHANRVRTLRVKKGIHAPVHEFGFDVDRFMGFISTFKNSLFRVEDCPVRAKPLAPPLAQHRIPNSNYRLESVPAVDYAIYLPANPEYLLVRDAVMNAFQTIEWIEGIPGVSAYLAQHPEDRTAVCNQLGRIIQGYSRSEVDGRFGLEDEKSWCFEITVLDDPSMPPAMQAKARVLSRTVLNHLIARRFAEQIGLEYQVWAKKLRETEIDRWVQEQQMEVSNEA